jgi:hypothetical protein
MPAPYPCPSVDRQAVTFDARLRKLVKTIVDADLTQAGNGAFQDLPLGFLPPGAVLFTAPSIALNAQFTGGGATSVGLSVGTAAAPTLVATSFDIFGSAATGLFVAMTRGAQRVVPGVHPSGGQQLVARITPDAGHNLTALTTGSLVLEVYFSNPESRYNP